MPCSSALRASAATPKPASRSLSMVGTPTYTAGMKATEQWLFTPGTGATPPVLAGREREQEVLNGCLARMAGGRSPPQDVVLVGPRGNGKTALLNWFEDACRKVRVNVARPAPSRVRTERALSAPVRRERS